MNRGTGYKIDPPDHRDRRFSSRIPGRTPRGSADLTAHLSGIRDQQSRNKCVGSALACGIDTRARAMGLHPSDYPNDEAIYAVARQLDPAIGAGALPDGGCYPRLAMKGLGLVGVAGEARFPLTPTEADKGVTLDIVRAGSKARLLAAAGLGYERVIGSRETMIALDDGFPVVTGFVVDDAFMSYRSGVLVRGGSVVGGHMVCAVGYRDDVILYTNSYGTSWGEGGLVWISARDVDDPAFTYDQYRLDFPKELVL